MILVILIFKKSCLKVKLKSWLFNLTNRIIEKKIFSRIIDIIIRKQN